MTTSIIFDSGLVFDSQTAQGTMIPMFAFANIAVSTTDGAVVSAVENKKIRVLAWIAGGTGTVTQFTFNSKGSGAGTAISSTKSAPGSNLAASMFSPLGIFETLEGEGLTITTGTGATIGIDIVYILV